MISQYSAEIQAAAAEIQEARKRLRSVQIPDEIAKTAIELTQKMGIDSLRSEITWFEAARAYAAADSRTQVNAEDLNIVAPMCLRLRRSSFMAEYFKDQASEETEMQDLLQKLQ
jgi:magnesium chelatase subunit I